jgi:hypothetical protein
LEPYHSFSIFNFTPYGFKVVCEDSGLEVKLMRPGIDGITLTERIVRERPSYYNQWFSNESPVNVEIERFAKKDNASIAAINFRKLIVCGQFAFHCVPKPR